MFFKTKLSMAYLFTHVVKFVVESAGVANRLSVVVTPPQRRHRRLAVGARRSCPSGRRLIRHHFPHKKKTHTDTQKKEENKNIEY